MASKKTASKRPSIKGAIKADGEFFASVDSPQLVRFSVLETRKTILESMKNFNVLKEIRKEKIHEKTHLRKNLRQISLLLTKIKSALPKVKAPSGDLDVLGGAVLQQAVQQAAPSHHEELNRIEAELADIDSQLSGL